MFSMIMDKSKHIFLLNSHQMCYSYKLKHISEENYQQIRLLSIKDGTIVKYLNHNMSVVQLGIRQHIFELLDLQKILMYKNVHISSLIILRKCLHCMGILQHINQSSHLHNTRQNEKDNLQLKHIRHQDRHSNSDSIFLCRFFMSLKFGNKSRKGKYQRMFWSTYQHKLVRGNL